MTQPEASPVVHAATRIVQVGGRARGRAVAALRGSLILAAALAWLPARAAPPADGQPFWPALPRPPLDPPLVVTGDFGEYRTGHFHAGLDFSTDGVKGRPVYACADGEIVRVRASGVGYGRSIYLQMADGRLLVYGHLDAFDRPLAAYVAAAQESSGQYEQDLWPAAGTMRVKQGQRLAWTGDSGAGGPHFHFEIRRADMAYAPSRAGLAWDDSLPPRLDAVWLEPLDDTSYVARSPAPRRVALGARTDTVLVQGRVRAVLDAYDPAESGDHMAAWSTEVEWEGVRTACVFDSISWADGMSEIDYVYDRGRATDLPRRALAPWASAGMRPRVIHSDAPLDQDAGTLTVHPGDPPRVATFRARDLAGNVTEKTLVLRAPRDGERVGQLVAVPDTLVHQPAPGASVRFDHDPLPYPYLRVSCTGVPSDARSVWFEVGWARRAGPVYKERFIGYVYGPRRWEATRVGTRWVAVVDVGADWDGYLRASAIQAGDVRWVACDPAWILRERTPIPHLTMPLIEWDHLDRAEFEPFVLVVPHPAHAGTELRLFGEPLAAGPTLEPLRRAFDLELNASRADSAHIGVYQDDGTGWSWLPAVRDRFGILRAAPRRLGSFCLAVDATPPTVTPLKAPRHAARTPYSRWALEARAADGGSGIDAHVSHFTVDGCRVPTEWDPEAGVLRWKPLAPPTRGRHAFEVVATDRAGNSRRAAGRFVLD